MRQFLLPGSYRGAPTLRLIGKDYRYLCRVRRLKPGDFLKGVDAAGTAYRLELESVDGESCTLSVERERTAAPFRGTKITLFQCLPKGRKMDLVVRQVTEAGIYRIVPVESSRSVRRTEEGREDGDRRERWKRIAREALQQSGTAHLPEIHTPVKLNEIPSFMENREPGLFFHQESLQNATLHGLLSDGPESLSYAVGPEGGFDDDEVLFLREHGFTPVYLGKNILRTETAALYGLAAIQLLLLEKDSWKTT